MDFKTKVLFISLFNTINNMGMNFDQGSPQEFVINQDSKNLKEIEQARDNLIILLGKMFVNNKFQKHSRVKLN